jgi:hypothetical protein
MTGGALTPTERADGQHGAPELPAPSSSRKLERSLADAVSELVRQEVESAGTAGATKETPEPKPKLEASAPPEPAELQLEPEPEPQPRKLQPLMTSQLLTTTVAPKQQVSSVMLQPDPRVWGDAAWAVAVASSVADDAAEVTSSSSITHAEHDHRDGGDDNHARHSQQQRRRRVRSFRYGPGDEASVLQRICAHASEGAWDRVVRSLEQWCDRGSGGGGGSSAAVAGPWPWSLPRSGSGGSGGGGGGGVLDTVVDGSHSQDAADATLGLVEFLLSKCWPLLPVDPHDRMQLDPRVSAPIVDAVGPPFRVVWWRVVAALRYIPHSDEADRHVTVTIRRRRRRCASSGAEWWEEVLADSADAATDAGGTDGSQGGSRRQVEGQVEGQVEELRLRCKVAMTVREAHAAVLSTGLSPGSDQPLVMRDGITYGGPHGASAVELEFFSHRWFRPWWEGCGRAPVAVRGARCPAHPDDSAGHKARALANYGHRAAQAAAASGGGGGGGGGGGAGFKGKGWRGEKFFWIDFCSVDQDDVEPGIASLPLYTALCERLVFFDSLEYDRRAWTRAERTIFVSRAFPSWNRSMLTEICLCHACSCHETEDGNAPTGSVQQTALHGARGLRLLLLLLLLLLLFLLLLLRVAVAPGGIDGQHADTGGVLARSGGRPRPALQPAHRWARTAAAGGAGWQAVGGELAGERGAVGSAGATAPLGAALWRDSGDAQHRAEVAEPVTSENSAHSYLRYLRILLAGAMERAVAAPAPKGHSSVHVCSAYGCTSLQLVAPRAARCPTPSAHAPGLAVGCQVSSSSGPPIITALPRRAAPARASTAPPHSNPPRSPCRQGRVIGGMAASAPPRQPRQPRQPQLAAGPARDHAAAGCSGACSGARPARTLRSSDHGRFG